MSEEFIREVDEELKEEKYIKLWKKIGPYVISFAVGIILFTTGFVGWNGFVEKKKQRLGDDFTSAVNLIKDKDIDTALFALEKITDEASDGYVTMAKMKKASILISQEKVEEGLGIYLDLEVSAIDQSFKDIATILYVLNAMDYKAPEILLKKIERLTVNNPWKFSALELTGFLHVKNNDISKANEVFNRILEQTNAPATLSGRARDMLEYLKGN